MKITILILTTLFSTTTFTQSNQAGIASQSIDNYGNMFQNNSSQEKTFYSEQSGQTTFVYDSIRALNEINDPANADAFPWISTDGMRLYFTSGANKNQLMFTQRADTNSYFSDPVIIPITISNPLSYWLSKDELDVYICTYSPDTLYYAHRKTTDSSFNTPALIHLSQQPDSNISYRGVSLNNAQNTLYISPPSGILEFSRTSTDSFKYKRTLPFPSGFTIHSGQLSKDELTFFFSASYKGGKAVLYQLKRVNPTDDFDAGTFQLIGGINDTTLSNLQPSMSDNLNYVVFVRENQKGWSSSDLYIAHKDSIASIVNPTQIQKSTSVFPNPSKGIFHLSGSEQRILNLEIYNLFGEKVFQEIKLNLSKQKPIDLSGKPKGIYFLKLTDGTNIISVIKLIIE